MSVPHLTLPALPPKLSDNEQTIYIYSKAPPVLSAAQVLEQNYQFKMQYSPDYSGIDRDTVSRG